MQLLLINARASGEGDTILPCSPQSGTLWIWWQQPHLARGCPLMFGYRWCQGCSGADISPGPLLCPWPPLPALQGPCPARQCERGSTSSLSSQHISFPRRVQAPCPCGPHPHAQQRITHSSAGSMRWQALIDPTVQIPNVLSPSSRFSHFPGQLSTPFWLSSSPYPSL